MTLHCSITLEPALIMMRSPRVGRSGSGTVKTLLVEENGAPFLEGTIYNFVESQNWLANLYQPEQT